VSGDVGRVIDLRVDGVSSPLGIDAPSPLLTWRIESDRRDLRQLAVRVVVASDAALARAGRGDVWDCGRIDSSDPTGVVFAGPPLESRRRYWWAVEVWTTAGAEPIRSEVAWWEMGLLSDDDWIAEWIAAENSESRADRHHGFTWVWGERTAPAETRRFRGTIVLPEPVAGGELLVMSQDWWLFLQILEVWVDGARIVEERWTTPDAGTEHELARHVRVTRSTGPLAAGRHVIAVEARVDATASRESFGVDIPTIAGITGLLRCLTDQGSVLRFGVDTSWRTSLEAPAGWADPAFDDSGWGPAIEADIRHQPLPPGPARHLRTSFVLDRPVAAARLYVTALGAVDATVNGVAAGPDRLSPGMAQYAERVRYRAHDVTALLGPGENVLGAVIGDGWYAGFDGRFAWGPPPRRLLAQLEIAFEDGTRRTIATGPGWRAADGPIRSSELKIGELHDARIDLSGWDRPAFDDRAWETAESAPRPAIRLDADPGPRIVVTEEITPAAITTTSRGTLLIDFAREFNGWCRVRLRGPAGAVVTLQHGQRLDADGYVDIVSAGVDPAGGARVDTVILSGAEDGDPFEPRFVYRSFRYVEIAGIERLDAEEIVGRYAHSDLERTGWIESSSPLVERLQELVVNTQRSTFVDVQHDNTIREYRGYPGEMSPFSRAAFFNQDLRTFVRRWATDIVDDQRPDGALPIAAPEPREGTSFCWLPGSSPGWGEGLIVMAWHAWQTTGDARYASESWDAMRRHVDFVADANPEFLWLRGRHYDFGDWLNLDPTPKEIFSTAIWAEALDLMAQMATATGRDHEARELGVQRTRVGEAFRRAFIARDGRVGSGTQTAQAMALAFDLVPAELRDEAAAHLVSDIRRRGHLTTGTFGTAVVLESLAATGHGDVAYDMLLREEAPSWGHMIRRGATSIWERWDGRGSTSQPALGSVSGFLFRRVAGIRATAPGYVAMTIDPLLDPRLGSGGGRFRSVRGDIVTRWRVDDGAYRLTVTIPPDATARIVLPADSVSSCREGGRELDPERASVGSSGIAVTVGSGHHEFEAARGL
jgi:alpha-L-rhamnosidase